MKALTFAALFFLASCATAPVSYAMGQPRGVQSCDRQGNCHWCTYVGNGTYDCR